MLFKKNKLKDVVVAYDEATKNVLFFRQENSGGFSRLGGEISLGKGSVRLEDQFQFIFFLALLSDISGLNSREFYCKYNLAYVFY
ncbi:MAG: hypothetical protein AAB949_01465 [Patescibacteria group bacterium]